MSQTNECEHVQELFTEENTHNNVFKPRFYIRHRFIMTVMLCISNLICYLDRNNMSIAIIPMAREYKWSETIQASVLSSFYWGYITTQMLSGFLSKKCGGKIVLYTGVAIWSCFTLLTPIAASLAPKYGIIPLFLVRIGMGIGEGMNFPAVSHLVGAWYPKQERTRHNAFILSGNELGTLCALFFGPIISIRLGWEWTFYIFGACGIVWIFAFLVLTSATPSDNSMISEYEKRYIEDSLSEEEQISSDSSLTVYIRIFSNSAVWAAVIGCVCFVFGYTVFLGFLPKIFLSIGVPFELTGLYSMMPYIVRFLGTNTSGYVADMMIKNDRVSVQNVRKIFQSISFIVPSIIFLIMRFTMKNITVSSILICIAIGATSCYNAGAYVNVLDLSPRNAGIINSILNTACSVPALVSSLITGLILDIPPPSHSIIPSTPWDMVFNVIIVINMIGAVIYVILAKGSPQFTEAQG